MPFEPKIKDSPEAYAYLLAFLEQLPHDYVLWRLEDFDDLGSFRMLYVSHNVAASTGLNMEQFVGLTIREAFPAFLDTDGPYMYREALRTGKPQELPALHFGDDIVPDKAYRLMAYPVGENLAGISAEDVTARVRAEYERELALHELESKAQELQRSNRELEEFAYVASHDLKAPLRDIENLATWIAEDAAALLPPRSQEHLQRLRDRAARMQKLLSDLLEYSRAGRVAQKVSDISLLDLLREALELIVVPEGFEVILPRSQPEMRTPRAPLEQIFINLMGNALKHHGGSSGRIEVSWRDAGENIEFKVSDDGQGIPTRFHDRVFRLFTTLRPRDEVEGSGMGLAMVKKLVETYGGAVRIESDEGKGCVFYFSWPKIWTASASPLQ